jgi:hypothetical protein
VNVDGIVLEDVAPNVPLLGMSSEVLRADELALPDKVCELLEEPPIELDGAGRLDELKIPLVVAELVDVTAIETVSPAPELEAEDGETFSDCELLEFDPDPVGLFATKSGAARFGPTMFGEERSPSTMMAHATPSSALTTGLSGSLIIFGLL